MGNLCGHFLGGSYDGTPNLVANPLRNSTPSNTSAPTRKQGSSVGTPNGTDYARKPPTPPGLQGSRLDNNTVEPAKPPSDGPSSAAHSSLDIVAAPPVSWVKGDPIGQGAFGRVFQALNNSTGELIAVKQVLVSKEESVRDRVAEHIKALETEVALLSSLKHKNIVQYIGTERTEEALNIFMEYMPGGSIASLVSRYGPLQESVIRLYTKQILEGLAFLHTHKYVHRDIKGANILLDRAGTVKLADFGASKKIEDLATVGSNVRSIHGTPYWMAPEVIQQEGRERRPADIWSVGCTVIEMATGKPPWHQCQGPVQVMFQIAKSREPPEIPEHLSPEAKDFLLLCFKREPLERANAARLLKHPFMADIARTVPTASQPIPPLALGSIKPILESPKATPKGVQHLDGTGAPGAWATAVKPPLPPPRCDVAQAHSRLQPQPVQPSTNSLYSSTLTINFNPIEEPSWGPELRAMLQAQHAVHGHQQEPSAPPLHLAYEAGCAEVASVPILPDIAGVASTSSPRNATSGLVASSTAASTALVPGAADMPAPPFAAPLSSRSRGAGSDVQAVSDIGDIPMEHSLSLVASLYSTDSAASSASSDSPGRPNPLYGSDILLELPVGSQQHEGGESLARAWSSRRTTSDIPPLPFRDSAQYGPLRSNLPMPRSGGRTRGDQSGSAAASGASGVGAATQASQASPKSKALKYVADLEEDLNQARQAAGKSSSSKLPGYDARMLLSGRSSGRESPANTRYSS